MAPRRPLLRRVVELAVVLVAAFGLAVIVAWLDPLPPPFAGAAQASDGDSLRIRGDRIRLLGIDAPELDQVCQDAEGGDWACGRAARDRLKALLAGEVTCQPEGTDRYGRTLATCLAGGADVGAAMVEAGLALAKDRYQAAEAVARRARRGLWQGQFVDPKSWRDEGPSHAPGPGVLEQLWDGFRELTGARVLR